MLLQRMNAVASSGVSVFPLQARSGRIPVSYSSCAMDESRAPTDQGQSALHLDSGSRRRSENGLRFPSPAFRTHLLLRRPASAFSAGS